MAATPTPLSRLLSTLLAVSAFLWSLLSVIALGINSDTPWPWWLLFVGALAAFAGGVWSAARPLRARVLAAQLLLGAAPWAVLWWLLHTDTLRDGNLSRWGVIAYVFLGGAAAAVTGLLTVALLIVALVASRRSGH